MKLLTRDHCVLNQKKDLEPLATFSRFPVFMGCTDQDPKEDLFLDMIWWISKSTGIIQLNPLIPLEILYPDQHNESFGQIWKEHHEKFSEFLFTHGCESVFEIGAAHGILAKNYQALRPNTPWTILEPNPRIVEGAKVDVIQGFFQKGFQFQGPHNAVVHSHVLEHIYEPWDFMQVLQTFVPDGKLHLFSIPNMRSQLESRFANCLNFEHTCFLTEPFLDHLLQKNGFEILEKKYFLDHSIFYATKRTSQKIQTECPDLYDEYKSLFTNYVHYYTNEVKTLNTKIQAAKHPVYLFGAHIFSQALIGFGLKTDKIRCILDNGPTKIGRRLYGTALRVESPKTLKKLGKAHVILKAGAYNNEIRKDILENINAEVEFWE